MVKFGLHRLASGASYSHLESNMLHYAVTRWLHGIITKAVRRRVAFVRNSAAALCLRIAFVLQTRPKAPVITGRQHERDTM